jgi:hypothetical protein
MATPHFTFGCGGKSLANKKPESEKQAIENKPTEPRKSLLSIHK